MKKVLFSLLAFVCLNGCTDTAELDESLQKIATLEAELVEVKGQLEQLSTNDQGLAHDVYFWLKDDITKEEEKAFVEGLLSLKKITSINKFSYGSPAKTLGKLVDNSYNYALSLHFTDNAALETYKADPTHKAFVEDLTPLMKKAHVYDRTLAED